MIPMRSWSYRGVERCIISTAQQARPKVMGQREPCRAQLATASRVVLQSLYQPLSFRDLVLLSNHTYSAYCTTLLFPSWLGNGTSVASVFFIGGGAPGFPCTFEGPSARFWTASAGFFEDEEMYAAGAAARRGAKAVVGLAMG